MATLLQLPLEILSQVVAYVAISAPTRQKRRLLLLALGKICKAFSIICLRQIYAKLAYEISPTGARLLSTLESTERYAGLVRALAIREREGGAQRKLVNSRTSNISSSLTTRARKTAMNDVTFEEKQIARLLHTLCTSLVELKWESNLLPAEDASFSELTSLQRFTCVPQPPFPETVDHDTLVQTATFTLPLPSPLFLRAFQALQQLNHLDLWKCSFVDFDSQVAGTHNPQIHLSTLVLQECSISSDVLEWLVKTSIQSSSLKTFKAGFLKDTKPASRDGIQDGLKRLIRDASKSLMHLSYDGDEGDLDSIPESDGQYIHDVSSPFMSLKRLQSLHLGGRAISSQHWLAIPPKLLSGLRSLDLEYTPFLSPADVLESLKAIPALSCELRSACVKGREDVRRRHLRELLYPSEMTATGDWLWSKPERVRLLSIMEGRGAALTTDAATAIRDPADEDQPSSDSDDFEAMDPMDYDRDFFVTAEQVSRLHVQVMSLSITESTNTAGRGKAY